MTGIVAGHESYILSELVRICRAKRAANKGFEFLNA
jgi:hypothetical protein